MDGGGAGGLTAKSGRGCRRPDGAAGGAGGDLEVNGPGTYSPAGAPRGGGGGRPPESVSESSLAANRAWAGRGITVRVRSLRWPRVTVRVPGPLAPT